MTLQTQKFPYSDIISLLGVDLKFNLAESTPEVLFFSDLLDEQLIEELKNLRLGYGTSRGLGPLRAMIAGNIGLLDENILITNGAATSIFLSIFCLCNPGDEVVVTSPNFPPILNIISAIGVTKRALQLQFDEEYKLNLDRFEKLLNKNTRLIILVSPQNPSGVITEPDELKAIVSHIEKKAPQAYLLVDETYREATYGNQSARSSAANLSTKVLTTASLSKCHGAPGIRIGWLTCRNDALLQQFTLAKTNTVISCSVIDELVGLYIYKNTDRILQKRKELLVLGLEKVESWINRNSEYIEWVRPGAGALCCIRLKPERFNDDAVNQFYNLIAKHQEVQVACGDWFQEDRRVFRLGFGFLPLETLASALETLKQVWEAALGSS